MTVDALMKDAKDRMGKSLHVLEEELAKLRGGRATPALIEDVKADYYGTPTPLKHMANIAAPEADLLVIRPFDPNQRQAIEKAILEANLGFNPVVDEEVVRVKVPRLSEERRHELVRLVHERGEESKVAIRNVRRDIKDQLERMKNEGELPEDDFHRHLHQLDELTHEHCDKVDELITAKDNQLKAV